MLRILQFLLILTLLSGRIAAQQDFKYHQQVLVSMKPGSSTVSNDILQVLSEGSGKTPRNTMFTAQSDQTLIVSSTGGTYKFLIRNSALSLTGDILFRGFSMTESLMPASITYTLKITAPGFNKEIQCSSSLNGAKPEDFSTSIRDTSLRDFHYSITNYLLKYNSNDLSEVRQRADLIAKYYRSVSELDQQYAVLGMIDPYNYSGFRTLNARIDNASKIYNDILSDNTLSALIANGNDPAKLSDKMTDYEQLLKRKMVDAAQVFQTLHLVFYERGNDAMRAGNNRAAYDLYHASLEVNPGFAPSKLQLARIDFLQGEIKESQCKADEVIYQMLPDPATRSNTIDLLRNIKDTYVDRGLSATTFKRYNQALVEFDLAKEICKRYPEIPCGEEIESGIEKVHLSVYKDQLHESKAALAQGNLSLAEKKVNESIRYFNNYLPGEPEEANGVLQNIRQKKYENLCIAGRQLTERGEYENAMKNYIEADVQFHQYTLVQCADFEKYSKIAAGKSIAVLLDNGNAAIKTNNVTQARADLQRALEYQSRFFLASDRNITRNADELRNKIFTKECANAQLVIDSAVVSGRSFLESNHYLSAFDVLEAGLNEKTRMVECGLFTDSLESLLNKVRQPGTYLRLMSAAENEVKAGRYKDAMKFYSDATNYYSENSISRYNLTHPADRDEFVLSTGDNGLINYCAVADMQSGKLENSLRLNKLLLDRNYSPAFMDDNLYELGRKTGAADKIHSPGGKAKKLAARYTGGDKRLKKFEKGFIKGYK